jgi:ADP-heptose:LPS heptosyltransferase
MKIFDTKRSFRKEFKRQIRLALVAAIGFTVAFAWKEAVFDTFQSFIARFLDVPKDQYLSETYTALAITLAGVLAIFITSKILRE